MLILCVKQFWRRTIKAKQKRDLHTCTARARTATPVVCGIDLGVVAWGVGIDFWDLVGDPEDHARANPGLDPNIQNRPKGELGGYVSDPDGAIPDSGPGN